MTKKVLKAKFKGPVYVPDDKALEDKEYVDRTREIERIKRERDVLKQRLSRGSLPTRPLTKKAPKNKPVQKPKTLGAAANDILAMIPKSIKENSPVVRTFANMVHRASGATTDSSPARRHGGVTQNTVPVKASMHSTVVLSPGQSGLFIFTPEGNTPLYFLSNNDVNQPYVDATYVAAHSDWYALNVMQHNAAFVTQSEIDWRISPQSLIGGTSSTAAVCLTSGRATVEIAVPRDGSCLAGIVGPDDADNFFGPKTNDISDLIGFVNGNPSERQGAMRCYHSAVGSGTQTAMMNITPTTLEDNIAFERITGATPEAANSYCTTFHTMNDVLAPVAPTASSSTVPQSFPTFYPQSNIGNLFLQAQGFFYCRNTSAVSSMTVTARMTCVYSTEPSPAFASVMSRDLEEASRGNPHKDDNPSHSGAHGAKDSDSLAGAVRKSILRSVRPDERDNKAITHLVTRVRDTNLTPSASAALQHVKSAHDFLSEAWDTGKTILKTAQGIGKNIADAMAFFA